MPSERFFPFDPRKVRAGLFICLAVGLLLSARSWAVAAKHPGWGPRLPAVLATLLALGCLVSLLRLRPRPGWGVGLDAGGITLSSPLAGPPIHLSWWEVERVSLGGKKQDVLVLWRVPQGQVTVGRQLFASGRDFEELKRALVEKKPPPRLDA